MKIIFKKKEKLMKKKKNENEGRDDESEANDVRLKESESDVHLSFRINLFM